MTEIRSWCLQVIPDVYQHLGNNAGQWIAESENTYLFSFVDNIK
jgi:hypothetical protein